MGLDVFIYRTKHAPEEYDINENGWSKVYEDAASDEKKNFRKAYKKMIAELKPLSGTEYNNAATKALGNLAKKFDYPEYDLKELGYDKVWDSDKRDYNDAINPVSFDTIVEKEDDIINKIVCKKEGYFRKVNCLYAYFQEKGTLINEVSWLTKEDANDLIDRCTKILENHELAEELLPTQCGFCFGSTDYDEYYFYYLENIIKQMKHLIELMDKGWNFFIEMNW